MTVFYAFNNCGFLIFYIAASPTFLTLTQRPYVLRGGCEPSYRKIVGMSLLQIFAAAIYRSKVSMVGVPPLRPPPPQNSINYVDLQNLPSKSVTV